MRSGVADGAALRGPAWRIRARARRRGSCAPRRWPTATSRVQGGARRGHVCRSACLAHGASGIRPGLHAARGPTCRRWSRGSVSGSKRAAGSLVIVRGTGGDQGGGGRRVGRPGPRARPPCAASRRRSTPIAFPSRRFGLDAGGQSSVSSPRATTSFAMPPQCRASASPRARSVSRARPRRLDYRRSGRILLMRAPRRRRSRAGGAELVSTTWTRASRSRALLRLRVRRASPTARSSNSGPPVTSRHSVPRGTPPAPPRARGPLLTDGARSGAPRSRRVCVASAGGRVARTSSARRLVEPLARLRSGRLPRSGSPRLPSVLEPRGRRARDGGPSSRACVVRRTLFPRTNVNTGRGSSGTPAVRVVSLPPRWAAAVRCRLAPRPRPHGRVQLGARARRHARRPPGGRRLDRPLNAAACGALLARSYDHLPRRRRRRQHDSQVGAEARWKLSFRARASGGGGGRPNGRRSRLHARGPRSLPPRAPVRACRTEGRRLLADVPGLVRFVELEESDTGAAAQRGTYQPDRARRWPHASACAMLRPASPRAALDVIRQRAESGCFVMQIFAYPGRDPCAGSRARHRAIPVDLRRGKAHGVSLSCRRSPSGAMPYANMRILRRVPRRDHGDRSRSSGPRRFDARATRRSRCDDLLDRWYGATTPTTSAVRRSATGHLYVLKLLRDHDRWEADVGHAPAARAGRARLARSPRVRHVTDAETRSSSGRSRAENETEYFARPPAAGEASAADVVRAERSSIH
jgi:hypothetical protein